MHHRFCALGAVAPSSDFLVRSGPFVCSSIQSIFFLRPECLWICEDGMGGKSAENAPFFLKTRETQCEPQFLLGVTLRASTELRGPTIPRFY